MSNDTLSTPREIDERLAELYEQAARIEQSIAAANSTLLDAADAKYYYRGRQWVTDMTVDEALEIVNAALAEADSDYSRMPNFSYSASSARRAIQNRNEAQAKLEEVYAETRALSKRYTGWSRFFLVTSSNGHIHSSMSCSTCRPTTTYGWLPNLSGKDMDEAISFFGPAAECLCSVCFPDAPVAKMDRNMTKKESSALLEGKTPEANTKNYCPGSGQQAVEPMRRGYAAGNWGTCGHCGDHVAFASPYSTKLRKHVAKVAVAS